MYRDAEDAATIPEGNDLKVRTIGRTTLFNFIFESSVSTSGVCMLCFFAICTPTLGDVTLRSPHPIQQVITREELPVQALARLEFGEHLLSVLGLAGTVKLKVAKNLPPVATNANAFRNSYLWDMSTGVLHLHGKGDVARHLLLCKGVDMRRSVCRLLE